MVQANVCTVCLVIWGYFVNIILLGKPGAGKGYVAQILKNEYNFNHISTGALCRKNVEQKTELGLLVDDYMKKGELVPSKIILEMLKDEYSHFVNQPCVFDGFPRTLEQAQELAKIIDVDAVVFVDVPDSVLISRVLSRKSCAKCGTVADFAKNETSCPKCGGEFVGRSDDNEQVVKNRLDIYNKQTKPLIDFYKNKIIKLDNSGEWSTTKKNLQQIIENLLKNGDR